MVVFVFWLFFLLFIDDVSSDIFNINHFVAAEPMQLSYFRMGFPQSMGAAVEKEFSQSIIEPTSQLINKPINQSINQPTNQPIKTQYLVELTTYSRKWLPHTAYETMGLSLANG